MAKKKVKNKRPSQVWKKYTVGNKLERKRTCIKCGSGYFLADHKDRWYCGKCHYVEIKR